MILDIIIVAIMILTMVFGFRKGFVYTFTHTLGWLLALAAGFALASPARSLLKSHTGIYDYFYNSFLERFTASTDGALSSVDSLPEILNQGATNIATGANKAFAAGLANLILAILCFILIFIVVKLILHLILRGFSKKHSHGFTGFFDGVLGLVAGALKGIIFVFVFLALMIPALNLIAPGMTDIVLESLDDSMFARTLYDSNFVVLLVDDFFKNFWN